MRTQEGMEVARKVVSAEALKKAFSPAAEASKR
jgi:hypothetical protein